MLTRTMNTEWPAQSDYIMALQDPGSAFIDPALAAGTVESDDVLDLPKPRSGQMASVYKLFDGPKTYAVRCFNFASDRRAARYGAISDFLARHPNPYTVGFTFRADGIVVAARPYPIVTMEWVEGDLLHTYIARHLDAPHVLWRLAHAWVEMVRELHALGLAHGDLQHGNVVVTPGGALKLIDYDGLFVPAFAGLPSLEDGHPNYQHPCREARHFGPLLDNFSAWSVYLSIVAVIRDRTLWANLGFGDDGLALRRADYVRPSVSAAFAQLTGAADPEVAKLARFVRSLLAHEPDRLPALEHDVEFLPAGGGGDACFPARFERRPLEPGSLAEPYLPQAVPSPQPEPRGRRVPRAANLVAAGIGLSGVGYVAFHAWGFATNQFLAVAGLAWVLGVILAFASGRPDPPERPTG